jgi:hypothetical protein
MGQKEKLIKWLKSKPKDFTFAELETLLRFLSYELDNKGRTSSSRVMFVSDNPVFRYFICRINNSIFLWVQIYFNYFKPN